MMLGEAQASKQEIKAEHRSQSARTTCAQPSSPTNGYPTYVARSNRCWEWRLYEFVPVSSGASGGAYDRGDTPCALLSVTITGSDIGGLSGGEGVKFGARTADRTTAYCTRAEVRLRVVWVVGIDLLTFIESLENVKLGVNFFRKGSSPHSILMPGAVGAECPSDAGQKTASLITS
jgi:hypothetical protein